MPEATPRGKGETQAQVVGLGACVLNHHPPLPFCVCCSLIVEKYQTRWLSLYFLDKSAGSMPRPACPPPRTTVPHLGPGRPSREHWAPRQGRDCMLATRVGLQGLGEPGPHLSPRPLRRNQVFPHRFYLQTLPEAASQVRYSLHHLEEPPHGPPAQGTLQHRRVAQGRPRAAGEACPPAPLCLAPAPGETLISWGPGNETAVRANSP